MKRTAGREGIEYARVLAGAGAAAETMVKLLRIAADEVVRSFDSDVAQILRDCGPEFSN